MIVSLDFISVRPQRARVRCRGGEGHGQSFAIKETALGTGC